MNEQKKENGNDVLTMICVIVGTIAIFFFKFVLKAIIRKKTWTQEFIISWACYLLGVVLIVFSPRWNERHTIVDRIKKGARARAERGLANGYVPLGFKLVEHRPNYRDVDENEKPYVEMLFRKFLELKRLNPLLKYLNENGHRTKEFVTKSGKKAGGNRWTLSSLHSVLTNRSYIGEREINKRHRSNSMVFLSIVGLWALAIQILNLSR